MIITKNYDLSLKGVLPVLAEATKRFWWIALIMLGQAVSFMVIYNPESINTGQTSDYFGMMWYAMIIFLFGSLDAGMAVAGIITAWKKRGYGFWVVVTIPCTIVAFVVINYLVLFGSP